MSFYKFPFKSVTEYGDYANLLGEGAFGQVHALGDKYVDKIINSKDGIPNSDAYREIALSLMVSSPEIMTPLDVYISNRGTTHIIMERADGDLRDFTWGTDYLDRKRWLFQAALGLADMHVKQMVHLDLKPRNILVFGDNAKLADLGLSQPYVCVKPPSEREGAFTLFYRPPEKLLGGIASMPGDIWALGVTVAEVMVSGPGQLYSPFVQTKGKSHDMPEKISEKEDQKIMLQNIVNKLGFPNSRDWPQGPNLPNWRKLPKPQTESVTLVEELAQKIPEDPDLQDLLLKIFQYNPQDRINIYQLLEHPWFDQLTKNQLPQPIGCFNVLNSLNSYPENKWSSDRNNSINNLLTTACQLHLQDYSLGLAVYLLDNSQPVSLDLTQAALYVAQNFAENEPVKSQEISNEAVIEVLEQNHFFLGISVCYLFLKELLGTRSDTVFGKWAKNLLKLSYFTDIHFQYSAPNISDSIYQITEYLLEEISLPENHLPLTEILDKLKLVAKLPYPSVKQILAETGCLDKLV